jgi:hypothetical protein
MRYPAPLNCLAGSLPSLNKSVGVGMASRKIMSCGNEKASIANLADKSRPGGETFAFGSR